MRSTLDMRLRMAAAAIAVLSALTACTPPASETAGKLPLTLIRDVPLPGGSTRLDYPVIDPAAKRLYITHLGDGTVHVLDLAGPSVVATIDGVSSVHGIALAPESHRVLASASGTDEAVIIDTDSLRLTGRVPTGHTPDGIAYDPAHGRAYVSNEHDHVETVIDVATGTAAGSIDVGGEAGNTVFDPVSGNIMINVQSTGQLITVNPATNRITGRISLTGCESNHGLYIDGADRLAFVACEGNAKLLVVDLDSQQTTGRIDLGGGPDVLAYATGLHRLYVASESGVVSVLDVQGKAVHELAKARLAEGAHTVAVDQATHRVYFPLENVNGKPVLRVMAPAE
jgi:DNA-binding beta-propeller fold protein YncE